MSTIHVEILAQTAENKLYPQYDQEAQILEVSSKSQRSWSYGVDIDGTIVFDLDTNRVLVNFDLLISKKLWRVVPNLELRTSARKGMLSFSMASIKHKSFHLPITVLTNKSQSEVLIRFGETKSGTTAISLSEKCIALVSADVLVGFFVSI